MLMLYKENDILYSWSSLVFKGNDIGITLLAIVLISLIDW